MDRGPREGDTLNKVSWSEIGQKVSLVWASVTPRRVFFCFANLI